MIFVFNFFTIFNGIQNNLFSPLIVEQEFIRLSWHLFIVTFFMLVYHDDPTILLVKYYLHLFFSEHCFVFRDNKLGFHLVVHVIPSQKYD